MSEEEKRAYIRSGSLSKSRLDGSSGTLPNENCGITDRKKAIKDIFGTRNLRSLSGVYAIAKGETYFQKNLANTPESRAKYVHTGRTRREKQAYFVNGAIKLKERDEERAKKFQSSDEFAAIKKTIETHGLAEMDGTGSAHISEAEHARERMSPEEGKAIYNYTGENYTGFNTLSISSGRVKVGTDSDDFTVPTVEDVGYVNDAARRITSEKPRMLYRGYKPPIGTSLNDYYKEMNPGDKFASTRVLSTTTDPDTASSFSNEEYDHTESVVMVYLPTRKGVAVGTGTSANPDEKEVILGAGEEFTVVDKKLDEEKRTMYLYVAADDTK